MADQKKVSIQSELDMLRCRRVVRELCEKAGFGLTDQTRIVTSTSELVRNICQYAGKGTMAVQALSGRDRSGIKLVFEDQGPGFDPERAMTKGSTTGRSLGMGLQAAKILMDEFQIQSKVGSGTRVQVVKWLKRRN